MRSEYTSACDSPGFLLWHATMRWQRTMRAALAPHDLTHVQFVLLASAWWLGEQGEQPFQRALERAGLVERLRDPADSRSMRVTVTAAGRERLQGALRDVEAADGAFFAAVADPALVPRLRALAGR